MIFTIATGRCGTKYLSSILSCVNNVISLHEPTDEVSYLRSMQKTGDTRKAEEFVRNKKIQFIKTKTNNYNISYYETSHVICKAYLEHLLAEYPDAKIIYLQRNVKDVAKSMYKHKSITQEMIHDDKARSYYRFPTDEICLFKLPTSIINSLTDFELCVWYWYETFAIYLNFKEKYNNIYPVSLKNLNTLLGIEELFQELNIIDYNRNKLLKIIGTPQNVGKDDSCLGLTNEEMTKSIEKVSNLFKHYGNIL